MMFAMYLDDMAGMVKVIVRFGKGPNAETLYVEHLPMFVAVIADKTERGYDGICA
jgi:hypothetical protein